MEEKGTITLCTFPHNIRGKASINTDAWSLEIFKGSIKVTVNLIDTAWCIKAIILYFRIFMTPNTGESTAKLFFDVFEGWGLFLKIEETTTTTGTDVISGNLRDRMDSGTTNSGILHVLYIAHIASISVR